MSPFCVSLLHAGPVISTWTQRLWILLPHRIKVETKDRVTTRPQERHSPLKPLLLLQKPALHLLRCPCLLLCAGPSVAVVEAAPDGHQALTSYAGYLQTPKGLPLHLLQLLQRAQLSGRLEAGTAPRIAQRKQEGQCLPLSLLKTSGFSSNKACSSVPGCGASCCTGNLGCLQFKQKKSLPAADWAYSRNLSLN